MELCLIVTHQMNPIPDGLNVVRDYGRETVIVEGAEHHQIAGVSMHLEGPKEIFIKWLQQFTGVWITNSPGSGAWYVVHIKKELVA